MRTLRTATPLTASNTNRTKPYHAKPRRDMAKQVRVGPSNSEKVKYVNMSGMLTHSPNAPRQVRSKVHGARSRVHARIRIRISLFSTYTLYTILYYTLLYFILYISHIPILSPGNTHTLDTLVGGVSRLPSYLYSTLLLYLYLEFPAAAARKGLRYGR